MSETTVDRKLLDIFEEAFDLYYSFETCTEPTNSPEFQVFILFLILRLASMVNLKNI